MEFKLPFPQQFGSAFVCVCCRMSVAFTHLYPSLMCLFEQPGEYRVRTKPSAEQVFCLSQGCYLWIFGHWLFPKCQPSPPTLLPSLIPDGFMWRMNTADERGLWWSCPLATSSDFFSPQEMTGTQPLPPQLARLASPVLEISSQRVPGARSGRENPSTHFPLPGKCCSPPAPAQTHLGPHTARDVFNGALWRPKPLSCKQAAKSNSFNGASRQEKHGQGPGMPAGHRECQQDTSGPGPSNTSRSSPPVSFCPS